MLKSIFAVLLLATGILYTLGTFGIGPMSLIGGLAMGKELNSFIGSFTVGYGASYICNLTFSPKEPVPWSFGNNGDLRPIADNELMNWLLRRNVAK